MMIQTTNLQEHQPQQSSNIMHDNKIANMGQYSGNQNISSLQEKRNIFEGLPNRLYLTDSLNLGQNLEYSLKYLNNNNKNVESTQKNSAKLSEKYLSNIQAINTDRNHPYNNTYQKQESKYQNQNQSQMSKYKFEKHNNNNNHNNNHNNNDYRLLNPEFINMFKDPNRKKIDISIHQSTTQKQGLFEKQKIKQKQKLQENSFASFGSVVQVPKISISEQQPNNYQPSLQNSYHSISAGSNIYFSPHLWYNTKQQSPLLRESLLKQQPPLIQYSQMNYQSIASYMAENNHFLFSDLRISSKKNDQQSKQNIRPSFKESEILRHRAEDDRITINGSVMEELDRFHKKVQEQREQYKNMGNQRQKQESEERMRRKKEMYVVDADSSSDDDSAQNHKIMALSNLLYSQTQPLLPPQHKPSHPNILPNSISINIVQPNTQNIQHNHPEQINSPYFKTNKTQINKNNQNNPQHQNNFQQQYRIMQNNYNKIIDELNTRYNRQLQMKTKQINQLRKQNCQYEERIRNLQIKISHKNKQDLSLQLILSTLKIQQQLSQHFHHSNKILQQNQHLKSQLQQQNKLIHNLTQQLTLLHTSTKKQSINIEFIDKTNTIPLNYHPSYGNLLKYEFHFRRELERLLLEYERKLEDSFEIVCDLERCLQQYVEEIRIREWNLRYAGQLIRNLEDINGFYEEYIADLKGEIQMKGRNEGKCGKCGKCMDIGRQQLDINKEQLQSNPNKQLQQNLQTNPHSIPQQETPKNHHNNPSQKQNKNL